MRLTPSKRDPASAPNSYNTAIFTDSFGDQAALGTQKIAAESLALFTSQYYRVFRSAVGGTPKYSNGGYRLDQVRTVFETNFPLLPYYITNIIIGGGINDAVADRALNLMTADIAAIANAVISNGNYNLQILIPSPFSSAHASRNASRIQKLLDYRAYVLANYAEYAIDLYSGLGAASDISTLDPFYIKTTTDLNPNDNGFRKIDELIGRKLFTRGTLSLTPHAGNLTPKPRSLSTWTFLSNLTLGGASTMLADGSFSTANGLINNAAIAGQLQDSWAAGIVPNATAVELTILFRPGIFVWERFSFSDNQGLTYNAYVNCLTAELGTLFGTGVKTTSARIFGGGFVELKMLFTTGTGTTANVVNIQPATADAAPVVVAQTGPSVYVDLFQIRAV